MSKITEGTLIPLSLVITVSGFIVWLTKIDDRTLHAEESIRKMQQEMTARGEKRDQAELRLVEKLEDIDHRLTKIQGMVEKERFRE